MCGIAGFTHGAHSDAPERIRRAVASLIHRGPDQQGVYESHSISLGVSRLKIIDLDQGDQPITADDGDTVVVFNGEIYNHQELRCELERRGHRFRSRSDTETLLYAFLEWDTDCFARLRGMFAVAFWTESKGRLVLARDRLGIKPLYVLRRGKDLYFGSELKAIFVHPEIERRLSLAGLDCYLSLNYVPCPWTLVEGIEKLPPGNWLEWRNGEVRCAKYWSIPFGQKADWTTQEACQELDRLLRDSVREHLVSDVPLGAWISGGIDSAAILHYAAQIASRPINTFSIAFPGRSFDETRYSRELATHYGTQHEELDLDGNSDLQSAIDEFAYYSDNPVADAGALPVWFLSKLSKTKVTVALSGEGADELLGGYITYQADRLARVARRLPAIVLRGGLGLARRVPVSDEKISFEYKLKRFLEGCQVSSDRAHVHWNGTFSDAEKHSLLRSTCPSALAETLSGLRENSSNGEKVAPYLWFDQKYYLPDDILAKADRMSMAHSLEVRPPFLDHRIVEFAAALPEDLKIRGACQKFLLKELMKDKLPASILRRKKVGFDIPVHEWLRGPLRSLLLDTLETGVRDHGALFRKEGIETFTRQHMERRVNVGYHLWGLMILFLWMRRWGIQTASITQADRQTQEGVLSLT